VLADGEILESGTHDELMERNGEYAKLFNLQAQYYR
jgi:ATP-binding cassette subfamily B protein